MLRANFLTVFLSVLNFCASAQEVPEPNKSARPAIRFHVLESWKEDLGNRSIYFNRVAPPLLQSAPAKIPAASAQASGASMVRHGMLRKASEVLFLTATVFDHKVTEIHWMDGEHECAAFSNIDFNLLADSVAFETDEASYSLLVAVTNVSSTPALKPAPTLRQIPSLQQFGLTKAQYILRQAQPLASPQEKSLAALDALHLYFDANRQRLAEKYAKREAARIEEEQRPKQQPSKPKDTVVNFWPGTGTRMIDAKWRTAK